MARPGDIKGFRTGTHSVIVHNENRQVLENMDALPCDPVYKRDLTIENYFGGYLKYPLFLLHRTR
jgi:hypothetical protein